jgi:hypothetical protein
MAICKGATIPRLTLDGAVASEQTTRPGSVEPRSCSRIGPCIPPSVREPSHPRDGTTVASEHTLPFCRRMGCTELTAALGAGRPKADPLARPSRPATRLSLHELRSLARDEDSARFDATRGVVERARYRSTQKRTSQGLAKIGSCWSDKTLVRKGVRTSPHT